MKLRVFSPVFGDIPLPEVLKFLNVHGVESIELGCGGFPGTKLADAKKLIREPKRMAEFKKLFDDAGIEISALSAHGNMVHPNPALAKKFREDFESACTLAGVWGVKRVVTFSGCPGGASQDISPNWVVCPWPEDFTKALDYQWNDVLIPFWQKEVCFAKSCGVEQIPLEMHPGFCCYNPETLLRLRKAVGQEIGANFDPSHLIWQGIRPADAIRALGSAIQFFHAKDTALDARNIAVNGVLDTKKYEKEAERSWIFRTVGYGSSELDWKKMFSALSLIGYDGPVSIEHEDSLMDGMEGLEMAIAFLQNILIKKPKPSNIWWA